MDLVGWKMRCTTGTAWLPLTRITPKPPSAKGVANAFAGPGAAWLFAKTGSWTKVFWAMIICDLIAAFMALLWLKPLARRMVEESDRRVHFPNPPAEGARTAA